MNTGHCRNRRLRACMYQLTWSSQEPSSRYYYYHPCYRWENGSTGRCGPGPATTQLSSGEPGWSPTWSSPTGHTLSSASLMSTDQEVTHIPRAWAGTGGCKVLSKGRELPALPSPCDAPICRSTGNSWQLPTLLTHMSLLSTNPLNLLYMHGC